MRSRGRGIPDTTRAPSSRGSWAGNSSPRRMAGPTSGTTPPGSSNATCPSICRSSAYASILGRAGLTGFFCMTRELKPQPGETAVVTSAAGAGGSIAGQIAKNAGCRVVGIVGSDEKVRYIVEGSRLRCRNQLQNHQRHGGRAA